MADRRTLEEILERARREPPVITSDDVRHMLFAARPVDARREITPFSLKRIIMAGLIVSAVVVLAVVLGSSGTEDRRAGIFRPVASAPRPTASSVAGAVGAQSVDSEKPQQNDPVRAQDPPDSQARTGQESKWGYHFVKGQRLRYRYVTEYSDPIINEAYSRTTVSEIFVEDVSKDGLATLVIRRMSDTMEQQASPVLPDGILVSRGIQPQHMRAAIDRFGRIVSAEIPSEVADPHATSTMVELDSGVTLRVTPVTERVGVWLAGIVPELPSAIETAADRTVRVDSVHSYQVPTYSEGTWSVAMQYDTVRSTTAFGAPRRVHSYECNTLVINETVISAGEPSNETSSVDELYLRKVDAIPVKITSTFTSHAARAGRSFRSTLELIDEEIPDSGAGEVRQERIN